jgi:hypothetical protein
MSIEAKRNYNYYSNEYERVNGNNNYRKFPMNKNITPRAENQRIENDTNVMVSSPTTAICASNVPLFRANLVKCIINEFVASFGLVDSGAT